MAATGAEETEAEAAQRRLDRDWSLHEITEIARNPDQAFDTVHNKAGGWRDWTLRTYVISGYKFLAGSELFATEIDARAVFQYSINHAESNGTTKNPPIITPWKSGKSSDEFSMEQIKAIFAWFPVQVRACIFPLFSFARCLIFFLLCSTPVQNNWTVTRKAYTIFASEHPNPHNTDVNWDACHHLATITQRGRDMPKYAEGLKEWQLNYLIKMKTEAMEVCALLENYIYFL